MQELNKARRFHVQLRAAKPDFEIVWRLQLSSSGRLAAYSEVPANLVILHAETGLE